MDTLRWLREIGNTVFAIDAILFVVCVGRMTIGRREAAATSADAGS